LLRGKHKPTFAPHVDTGDFVVIVNAEKVAVSGNKRKTSCLPAQRLPGGLRQRSVGEMLDKHPDRLARRPSRACCRRTGSAGHGQEAQGLRRSVAPARAQQPLPFEITQVSQ